MCFKSTKIASDSSSPSLIRFPLFMNGLSMGISENWKSFSWNAAFSMPTKGLDTNLFILEVSDSILAS